MRLPKAVSVNGFDSVCRRALAEFLALPCSDSRLAWMRHPATPHSIPLGLRLLVEGKMSLSSKPAWSLELAALVVRLCWRLPHLGSEDSSWNSLLVGAWTLRGEARRCLWDLADSRTSLRFAQEQRLAAPVVPVADGDLELALALLARQANEPLAARAHLGNCAEFFKDPGSAGMQLFGLYCRLLLLKEEGLVAELHLVQTAVTGVEAASVPGLAPRFCTELLELAAAGRYEEAWVKLENQRSLFQEVDLTRASSFSASLEVDRDQTE